MRAQRLLNSETAGALFSSLFKPRIGPRSLSRPLALALGLCGLAYQFNGNVQAQPAFFSFGLPQTPLGQAIVSTNPLGNVIVSNLSSNGQDGVEIALGTSRGLYMILDLPPSNAIPLGATIRNQLHVEVPGVGDSVDELRIKRTTNGFQITPDFSPGGSPTYSLTLLSNGVVVYHQIGVSGPAGVAASLARDEICHTETPDGLCHVTQSFALTTLDLGGEVVVTANVMLANSETAKSPGIHDLRVDSFASGISNLTISGEFLFMFDNSPKVHQSLGNARFSSSSGQLTMTNIGSSGQDGVRVDFDRMRGFSVPVDFHGISAQLVPLALQTNEAFKVSAIGVFSGISGSSLGEASLRNNGGLMQLSGDFSVIGAQTVRVEVYNSGLLVGSMDASAGSVVGTLAAGARIAGCGRQAPRPLHGFIFETELPVSFAPAIGGPITGNEFRVLAAGAHGSIDRLSFFDVSFHSEQAGGFSIVGETPDLLPPPITLRTSHSDANLVLAWHASATTYALTTTTVLPNETWGSVTNTPLQVGNDFQVVVQATNSTRFFRLIQQ